MGILKTLTDEYFKNAFRGEDGKFIEVKGFKTFVPTEFDEETFLEKVETIINESNCAFLHKYELPKDENYVKIECDDDFYLSLDPIEYFRESIKDLTDIQIDYAIKFIGFLLENVPLDRDRDYGDCIVLMNEKDCENLDSLLYDAGLDEFQSDKCWKKIKSSFIENFHNDAYIIKDEIFSIQYTYITLNLKLTNTCNEVLFRTILYAKEMVKWWKDKLDEIKKIGVSEFFEIDTEEE